MRANVDADEMNNCFMDVMGYFYYSETSFSWVMHEIKHMRYLYLPDVAN